MIFDQPKAVCMYSILAVLILFLGTPATSTGQNQEKSSIQWYSMEEAQRLAKKHDKKVLVYAEASWCVYCKKMEQQVFPEQSVIDSLNAYYFPVRVDIESDENMSFNDKVISKTDFARSHKVRATPTFFFIDDDGEILGGQPGFIPADTFSSLLAFVGSGAFQKMDFKLYVEQNTTAKN